MSLFNIVVDPSAERDLKKLKKANPKFFPQFVKIIDSLALSPYQGKPLKENKKGCYSVRHDPYRIIYEIYLTQRTVHIIQVGHRREVYR